MKKLFTLLVATLIAATTFAQITPRVIKGTPVQIGNKHEKASVTAQKNVANADYWYNYADALEVYWGLPLDGIGAPIFCDTSAMYYFNDTMIQPCQFMSFGQEYDWNNANWEEFYTQELFSGLTIPHLGETSTYSIDSVEVCMQYHWGTNVATDVVDTFRMTFVLNMDQEAFHTPGNYFNWHWVPYNNRTYTAAKSVWDPTDSTYINMTDEAVIVTEDIILTHDDVTDSTYFYYVKLPIESELLSNLSCKKMAVAFTFVPGVHGDGTYFIGNQTNSFRAVLNDDPREEYNTYGSEELMNDVQMGLFTDADNYDETKSYFPLYQPNIFWLGNPKPYIGLHVTCNDCAVMNVPEIENAAATIYPNPATSEITVITNTNEKVNVEMFNLVGQKVYSEQVVNNTKINVSNMKAGVYMLKVNNHTTKVVVK